jgi:hypothetical protein
VRRPRLSSKLFQLARQVDDVEALGTADPKRIARPAKNKVVGRLLGRAGSRRRLFG